MFTTLEEFKQKLHDSKVPFHLQEGILNWVERGVPAGGYLRAVFNNDLAGAVLRGDSLSRSRLVETVTFIWSECPDGSYTSGSHKSMTWNGLNPVVRRPTDG